MSIATTSVIASIVVPPVVASVIVTSIVVTSVISTIVVATILSLLRTKAELEKDLSLAKDSTYVLPSVKRGTTVGHDTSYSMFGEEGDQQQRCC